MASKITNSMVQTLTLKESLKLRDSLNNHIDGLQKAQQAEVLEKVQSMLDEVGLSVDSLIAPKKKTRKSSGSIPPKYDLNGVLWTGRGRKPVVYQEFVDGGGNLDELLINKD
jgi:DNA-binding protein H-NS